MFRTRIERFSVSPEGVELITFVSRFARCVLAESATHRNNSDTCGTEDYSYCERTITKDISRNTASSRAISSKRMVEAVEKYPYMPAWTLEQKGMQGAHTDNATTIANANQEWLDARAAMIHHATNLNKLGIHKQDCNRLLEPWAWTEQVITSSKWDNFFALRCHEAAHPAIRKIARMMFVARQQARAMKPEFQQGTPVRLKHGEWHLPFIEHGKQTEFNWKPQFLSEHGGIIAREEIPLVVRNSCVRCAWVSYSNHDRVGTQEAMDSTWNKATNHSGPMHASIFEHQATPITELVFNKFPHLQGNLSGYIQLRKLLPGEQVIFYQPTEEEVASWQVPCVLWQED